MSVQEHSVWINAKPEDVWRVYVDPRRIPDWETGASRAAATRFLVERLG